MSVDTKPASNLSDFYSPNKAADDEVENLAAPQKPNIARTVSYVLGALATVMLVAAVIMLIMLRNNSTVITTVVPTHIVTITVFPPVPEVKLQPLSKADDFSLADFLSITSVVATVTDASPVLTPGSTATPAFEPGMAPFPDTINFPLQNAPQGYGWVAITPAADQWFSSMPNGYASVGQYLYNEGKFEANKEAYTTPQNNISFCIIDPLNPQNDAIVSPNTAASSVGSVGYGSIAMSQDGTRLYTAYRQPLMQATKDAQIFPFLQLSGQVSTFMRATDPSGGLPTETNWSMACSLGMSNPFGSQTAQFDQICDPSSGNLLTGDDFGSLLRVSTNLSNGNRMVAARANFGLRINDGAFITVYEETNDDVYTVTGIIFLSDGSTTFTLAEKLAFGRDFALGNDALLCAVRTPAGGCGVVTPRYNLFFFRHNRTLQQWEYKQTITPPADTAINEDFGVSLVMNAEGTLALVGSPHLPNGMVPGVGGNVYFYQRTYQAPDVWTQTQTFSDPLSSSHPAGAFGYFLSVDSQFLVLAISANQNNVLNAPKTKILSNSDSVKPYVVLVAINQETAQIDASQVQQQVQPDNQTDDYLDPLFGGNVAMAFEDAGRSIMRVLLPSPMNQKVFFYTMTVQ